MKIERPASREEIIKAEPLGEYFVWWDDITTRDVEKLEKALASAKAERDMQALLEAVPQVLVQHLRGGHGRWVIPQKKLGAEHVTDFVIGHAHSYGHEWTAVELESPCASMFTKKGDPSSALSHAIRQIQDWRAWLKRNQDYASRPRTQSGLGLKDVDCNIPGLIVIGRRSVGQTTTHELRRQMCQDLNIQIHSYDTLVDWANSRVGWCEEQRRTKRQNQAL